MSINVGGTGQGEQGEVGGQSGQDGQREQGGQYGQGGQREKGLTFLLTGGRAPATLELARLLAGMGRAGRKHTVYVAESVEYHLCRRSRAVSGGFSVPSPREEPAAYIRTLRGIIEACHVDVLIPTCEEIFYVARGMEQLTGTCSVFTDSFDKLKQLHSKWEFIELARRHGFRVPETWLITSPEEWTAFVGRYPLHTGLVFKPVYSRFAAKVIVIEPEPAAKWSGSQTAVRPAHAAHTASPTMGQGTSGLRSALSNPRPSVSAEHPWVAQQYIHGRQICTYSVVHAGTVVAHAAYETRFTAGRGACIHFEPIAHEAAAEWVSRFVRLERFTGQIAFDFMETADGDLYPLECNPRATSGLHLFRDTEGIDLAFADPDKLSGAVLTPKCSARTMVATAMLLYGPASARAGVGWTAWMKALLTSRDVICRRSDMQPAVEQLRMFRHLWKISRTRGITLMEAATCDIEWNGEE